MPELPEVETTRLGLCKHILGHRVLACQVHNPRLRYPITPDLSERLQGAVIQRIDRRAKYLLLYVNSEAGLLMHLGMSGRLEHHVGIVSPSKHVHIQWMFQTCTVQYRDPRRFGLCLWSDRLAQHPLLQHLGPEPLSPALDANYLWQNMQKSRSAIKLLLMDQKCVAGLGNIYVNEALFQAGIHPNRPANSLSSREAEQLVSAIRAILSAAIQQGGTTLRDFASPEQVLGYFQTQLSVYGRASQPCVRCAQPLVGIIMGQRATVYCGRCQS